MVEEVGHVVREVLVVLGGQSVVLGLNLQRALKRHRLASRTLRVNQTAVHERPTDAQQVAHVHTVRHCTQTVKGVREIDNDSHPADSADAGLDSAVVCVSPLSGARLTREQSRKGGRARIAQMREQRDEARKTALQRLAEKLEAEADTILATYMAAIRDGDWRAAEALYDRVYGKATQRQEIEDVTDREIATDTDLERLEALEAELKRRKAA